MATEIEVDQRDVLLAVLMGLAQPTSDEGVYEFTEKGNSWLRQWCAEQIAKADKPA
jgi:hypothetical protein